MKRHIKLRLGISFFSKKASQGKQNRSLEDKLPGVNCIHDSYCVIKQKNEIEHCSKKNVKYCGQPIKFYNKYGEQGNQMGVGS